MIHRQSFSVLWEKVLVFLAFSKEGSNGHDTIRAIIQFGNLHETGFHQGIIDCMVECWRNLHLFGIIMLVLPILLHDQVVGFCVESSLVKFFGNSDQCFLVHFHPSLRRKMII